MNLPLGPGVPTVPGVRGKREGERRWYK
jgi:hypothetical protein